jgi:hypothetical protein
VHCIAFLAILYQGTVAQYKQISLILLLKPECMGILFEVITKKKMSKHELMTYDVCQKSKKKINKLFKQPIVGCFISNQDIMRMTLGHSCVGNTNKFCFFLHFLNRL